MPREQRRSPLPRSSHPFLRTAERGAGSLRPVANLDIYVQGRWLLASPARGQGRSQCLAGRPQPLTAPGLPPAHPRSGPGDTSNRPGQTFVAPHHPRSQASGASAPRPWTAAPPAMSPTPLGPPPPTPILVVVPHAPRPLAGYGSRPSRMPSYMLTHTHPLIHIHHTRAHLCTHMVIQSHTYFSCMLTD